MFRFKPLVEEDLILLYQWFQVPHIKKWYARGQHFSFDMIKEKYLPRINPQKSIILLFILMIAPLGISSAIT